MIKILFVVGGLVVAAVGGVAYIFSIGQHLATYEVALTLLDEAGRPLALQPVVVWRYDYPRQVLRTDSAGQLTWRGAESFSASALVGGPRRPTEFLLRLAFPSLSPLYYRFGLRQAGTLPYQVFNTEYDYYFGHQWVGDVDAAGHLTREITQGAAKTRYLAVAPTGGQLPRWQARATLRHLGRQPAGHHFGIGLTLRQAGLAPL